MGIRRNAQDSVSARSRLVSRTVRLGETSLRALVQSLDRQRFVWSAANEPSVVACGATSVLSADGPSRFSAIRERAEEVFARVDRPTDAPAVARPRLFGGFSFHDRHEPEAPWTGFPGAQFVLPHVQFTVTSDETFLTVNEYGADASTDSVRGTIDDVLGTVDTDAAPPDPAPGIVARERTTDRETWRGQVEEVVERIQAGALEKAVLAQSLRVELGGEFDLVDTLGRLAETYPDCFQFAVRGTGSETFFGATPERLVSRQGGRLETGALASTMPRGSTPAEDAELEVELRESTKFQHEHALVAESIRDQLSGHAENVTTGEQGVRKLANVQHLFTPIAADTDEHVLELVSALHPTPAVGGLPPAAALDAIREVETFDRGWYAAPVGWFDADGDGTFAVGIRSAVASDREATLFAGNGIVADSDPDAEWKEVLLKYRPVLDALE